MALNDDAREFLFVCYNAGDSAAVIAAKIYKKFGQQLPSRNAILGYIHRAQKAGLVQPIKIKKNKAPRQYQLKPVGNRLSKPLPKIIIAQQAPQAIGPWNDFPGAGCCKFTPHDVGHENWQMCGQPTSSPADPWCLYHRHHDIYPRQPKGPATHEPEAAPISSQLSRSQAQPSAA